MLLRELPVDDVAIKPIRTDSVDSAPQTSAPGAGHHTISVVIPTKNEARNIAWVLQHMDAIVDEVILVDFQSTDGTVDVARMIRPDVVVVHHPVPGKGEAVRAGLAAATGDFVVMIDADGSMDPAEIRSFVQPLAEGHDLAKGSRFVAGGGTSDMTILRRSGNAGLVALSNVLLGARYSELCYGYMAFRRSRIHELGLRSTGFEIETEIVVRAHRAGLSVIEVPSFESPRRHGVSNLHTFRDGWRVLKTIFRERVAPLPQSASDLEPARTKAS